MKLAQLTFVLDNLFKDSDDAGSPKPELIIVHCGMNDLPDKDSIQTFEKFEGWILNVLHNLIRKVVWSKNTKVVWSDLLPRLSY